MHVFNGLSRPVGSRELTEVTLIAAKGLQQDFFWVAAENSEAYCFFQLHNEAENKVSLTLFGSAICAKDNKFIVALGWLEMLILHTGYILP